ncbi:MAG: AMP-binding protein [Paracoccaceae bacterium]
MSTRVLPTPIWTPTASRVSSSVLTDFLRWLAAEKGVTLDDSAELHRWSVTERGAFWDAIWDYFGVIGDKFGDTGDGKVLTGTGMLDERFFPGAGLNFAENLLELGGTDDRACALVFRGEDRAELRWSWGELRAEVSRLAQALAASGVGVGDRVAGLLPNRPEAIAAMLATAALGATWSSASPDFGARAVLDRFAQIAPKVLFATDGYWYNGKRIEIAGKLAELLPGLPSVHKTVVIDYLGQCRGGGGGAPGGGELRRVHRGIRPRAIGVPRWRFDHRSTSCSPRAPPGRRNASFTGPAACSCNTSRNSGCTPT